MFEKFNNHDRKIFGIAAALFLLAMSMTLSDEWLGWFTDSVESQLQPIGSVEISQNDVRRRYKVEFSWSSLAQESTVYQGDSIFTGNDSTATIRTINGDEIIVAPNSLVVINTDNNNINIEIGFGSIEGQLRSNNKIFVSTQNKITELGGGENSKVRIDAGDGNSLVLDVLDGSINISEGGVTKTLNKFDVAEVGGLGDISDKDFKTLRLLSPMQGQRYRSVAGLAIPFKWETIKQLRRAFITVATDPEFKNVVLKSPTSNLSFVGYDLPVDKKLYWTVFSEGSNSEVGEFWVLDIKAPELILPEQGKHFYFDPDIPKVQGARVNLSWAGGSPSRRYEVQVAKDANFSQSVQSFISNRTSFETPVLASGNYFWKVRGLEFTDSEWSSVHRFKVGPEPSKDVLPPAPNTDDQLILITREHKLSQDEFTALARPKIINYIENPIAFSWSKVSGARQYELEVATDKDFKQIVVDTKVTRPQYTWKFIEPGTYYWRIRSFNELNYKSPFTPAKQLVVSVAPPVVTSNPVYVEEVSERELLNLPVPPIELRWRPTVFADRYEVLFSTTPEFEKPLQFISASNKRKVQLPSSGIFYWKIRALGSKQLVVSKYSNIQTIEFKRVFRDPRLSDNLLTIAPKMNDSILLVGNGNSEIVFEWSKPFKKADYELQISTDNDFENIVHKATTEKAIYALQKRLPPGNIFWRVRALKDGDITPWSSNSRFLLSYEGTPYDAETYELIYQARRQAKERQKRVLAALQTRLSKLRKPAGATDVQLDTPEIINTKNFIVLQGNFSSSIDSFTLAKQNAEEFQKQIKDPPKIQWKHVLAAERYFVEIAGDPEFKNIVEKQPSYNPYYVWESARPGLFYYRVQAFNDRYTRSNYSKVEPLHIEVERPISYSPQSVVEIMDLPREMWAPPSPFKLSWSPRIFAKHYEFEFSEDKAFKYSKLFRTDSAEKEVHVSKSGTFYWRVRPVNEASIGISPWSETYLVEVSQGNRSPASEMVPDGLYPLSRTIIQIGKGALDFAFFLTGNLKEKKVIELSNTASFDSILSSATTSREKTLIRIDENVPEGKVYWRVRDPNSVRQPASSSKVYEFDLRRELEPYRMDK